MYEVAEGVAIPSRTLSDYCSGQTPIPRKRLEDIASFLECPVENLEGQHAAHQAHAYQGTSSPVLGSEAMDRKRRELLLDMNHSRRFFLQALGLAGTALVVAPEEVLHASTTARNNQGQINVSASTIENLLAIAQEYRSLQRAGLATGDGLRSLIGLIQNALENTVNDMYRRELWKIQAQSQLLARHSITKKHELGQARTWNEAAVASAQYSGDTLLLGATLGHLGHLYLIWQDDPVSARQLLDLAQEYTRKHPVSGWFAMVTAAIAAEEKNQVECEASITKATEIAHSLPEAAESSDLYYTDFNVVGVDAFAGNCLLKVGKPSLALERLNSINLDALAGNRHASAYYDMASAYAQTGELEAMQTYAFRSIDKALSTDRLYIIPRCITLAQGIQARDPGESHAAAILEYTHIALHENPKGGLA